MIVAGYVKVLLSLAMAGCFRCRNYELRQGRSVWGVVD